MNLRVKMNMVLILPDHCIGKRDVPTCYN